MAQRIKVHVSEGDGGVPTPHVVNISGLSDERGRFSLWDKVQSVLAYDTTGSLTVDWSRLDVSKSLRQRIVVVRSL